MGVSFRKDKGAELDVENAIVGLGWKLKESSKDPIVFSSTPDPDLDLIVLLLDPDGKVRGDGDCVFYNQPVSACGSVRCLGDNLTGGAIGDNEQVSINLHAIPEGVARILTVVTIYKGREYKQDFSKIDGYLRVFDSANEFEIARVFLDEESRRADREFWKENTMICGEFVRVGKSWKFRVLSKPIMGGLVNLVESFGVQVSEGY